MSTLNDLAVSKKIGLGFAVVIALTVVISLLAVLSLSSIGDLFGDYRNLARESNAVGRVQANLLNTRMGVKDFIIKQDEDSIAVVRERGTKTLSLIDSSEQFFSGEKKQALESMKSEIKKYESTFEQVVEHQGMRNQYVGMMDQLGPQIEKDLTQVMKSAYDDGDAEAAYYAGLALRRILLARLYAFKFLQANLQQDFDRASTELKDFEVITNELLTKLQNPERRRLTQEANQKHDQYIANFNATHKEIMARNELIVGTLDTIGPRVADNIENFKLQAKKEQDTLGPQAVTEIDKTTVTTSVISFVVLILGVLAAIFISRSITKPLPEIVRVIDAAAAGDLTQQANIKRKDEIGRMAHSFNALIASLRTGFKDVSEASASIASAAEELSAASNELSRHAERMNSETVNADEAVNDVSQSINELASISTQLSGNADTVASASTELSASIAEVLNHAQNSSNVSHEAQAQSASASNALMNAQDQMNEAKINITALASSAQEIGEVVSVISAIAEQTNLLALNATIESARAGEAGKGFAVVANEVKNLASQTSKATEDIANRIQATQNDVDDTVKSIDLVATSLEAVNDEMSAIAQVINDVDNIATSIAGEVDQQKATTEEISRNVEEVATAARAVSEDAERTNVDAQTMRHTVDISAEISNEIAGEATQTSAAANELSRLSTRLDDLVRNYRI